MMNRSECRGELLSSEMIASVRDQSKSETKDRCARNAILSGKQ